jgi:hypothetical protein
VFFGGVLLFFAQIGCGAAMKWICVVLVLDQIGDADTRVALRPC